MSADSPLPGSRDPASEFSIVDNEPPLRWQRRLRLAPAQGLGLVRRAVFFALLGWLPIVIWAALTGQQWIDDSGERLLQHYGVHVRCLLAIPLLILAEGMLYAATRRVLPQFMESGIITADTRGQLEALQAGMRRLRDSSLPWVLMLGVVIALGIGEPTIAHSDEMAWSKSADGTMGFGGWWYFYVVRSIFLALLLGWLWRIILVTVWLGKFARLPLSLVPTHPDRVGGLGFLEALPMAFAPVSFAVSALLASRWAHEIVHHGASVAALKLTIAGFVLLWSFLLLMPLLSLIPVLASTRRRALRQYSNLIAEQGRQVYRRWIGRDAAGDTSLLDVPEIGPVADANVMFDAVKAMRPFPVGSKTLVGILLPLALPLIVMAALEIPLKELLLKLLKTLI